MKFLVVAALAVAAASAEPEADPSVLLNGGILARGPLVTPAGLGLGLGLPLLRSSAVLPIGAGILTRGPLIGRAGIWKREAEAEPEADPSLLLGAPASPLLLRSGLLGSTLIGKSILTTPAATAPLLRTIIPGTIIGGSPLIGRAGIWKREAEAEPEADPSLLLGAPASPLLLRSGLLGSTLIGKSILTTPAATAPLLRTIIPGTIIGGSPLIGRAGIWKREAEAEPEADPSLLLGSPVVLNTGISAVSSVAPQVSTTILGKTVVAPAVAPASPLLLPSTKLIGTTSSIISTGSVIGSPLIGSPLIGSPLIGSPLITKGIWKRDADAEPEADPSLLVGSPLVGSPLIGSPLVGSPLLTRSLLTPSVITTAPAVNIINSQRLLSPLLGRTLPLW